MASRVQLSVALLAGLAVGQGAQAQWLSFTDATGSRLQLSTVGLTDNKEKDIEIADFNRDGWDDLYVGRKLPFSVMGPASGVLLMNQNGVMVDKTAQYAPGFITNLDDARDAVAADFDNDGWVDLIIGSTFEVPPAYYRNRGNDAGGNWLGLAREVWRIGPIQGTPSVTRVCAMWAGDVDNDLDLDVYFCGYNGDTDFIMINDGTGNFTDQTTARLGNYANVAFGTAVELRDFDLDGDLDIMKVSTLFSEPPFNVGVFILWNDGSGVFKNTPFHTVPSTSSPYMCSAGHLDPGNTWDLYIVQDGQDQVKKATVNGPNNVSWTQITMTSPRTTGFGGSNHFADLDNDGDLDHGVGPIDVDIQNCGGSGGVFALLRNDGTGNLQDPYTSSQNFHIQPHDFAFIDIDRDGCKDIFMGLCVGWKVFMRNSCPPPPCYPDCNGDGLLNLGDFGCFQTAFATGNMYADCNGDTLLNLGDFGCFMTKFAIGCP